MALTDKYQSVISLAQQNGVSNLQVSEENNVLHVTGTAPNEQVKQQIWDEYNRLDPDMRSGDMVMDINVAEGAAAGAAAGGAGAEEYTIQHGDSLSKIGAHFGVNWHEIFEANRDQIQDPDKIYPGQKIRIPRK